MPTDLELMHQLAALVGGHIKTQVYGQTEYCFAGPSCEAMQGPGDVQIWPERPWGFFRVWRPLTDMNDAMQLVQKLRAAGWHYELGDHISDPNIHGAAFGRGYWDHYNHSWSESVEAAADAPARAICLAALETREEGR